MDNGYLRRSSQIYSNKYLQNQSYSENSTRKNELSSSTVLGQAGMATIRQTQYRQTSPIDSRSSRSRSNSAKRPYRVYPQNYLANQINFSELKKMERSPVVFEGNMSFVFGSNTLHQTFRPVPAYMEKSTVSNRLSNQIENFLKKTDHVNQEWSALHRKKDDSFDLKNASRSKSVSNIMIKGFQLMKYQPSASRSNSAYRQISEEDDDRTICEEISEMSLDLLDEHSTANVISECLEAETTERLRLEEKCQTMLDNAERFEKELKKSDFNGRIAEDDDGLNEDYNVYKLKYESVAKELEFTKKRLHSQHAHDLEQLVGLKKQLEKKLADAYEELDEQRQIVGQWKKKTQKISNEMSDLRMLLEEQNNRNILLEKRQKKFDIDCQTLQDAAKQEKLAKEQLLREKDVIQAEKFHMEQKLAETNLELEFKENHLKNLKEEFEETFSSEGELNELKKRTVNLNRLCKDQEAEIEELACSLELLEKSKLKLELELESMRKEHKKELQSINQEVDNQSIKLVKKIKALELELETEYSERSLLLREKLELDRVVTYLQNQVKNDTVNSEKTEKLKRDLKKYKALLNDARLQLENSSMDAESKSLIRQLKHKLEDVQSSEKVCQRAKHAAETELAELTSTLEDVRAKNHEILEMYAEAQRNIADLQAQTEETEIEMGELIKKYQKAVSELNDEQKSRAECEIKINELESQKSLLKERIAELDMRLENSEDGSSVSMQNKLLELRIKELESKIEIDLTARSRQEGQMNRFKSEIEKLKSEIQFLRAKDEQSAETLKKAKTKLNEMREENQTLSYREQEANNKLKDLEKRMNDTNQKLQSDLRFAQQRISDLQMAIENETDVVSESDLSDSSNSDEEDNIEAIN